MTQTITLPGPRLVAMAFGAGALWVANQDSGTISRVDPRRGRVVSSVHWWHPYLPRAGRRAHQFTDNAVWVPTVNEREVELVSRRLRNYEYNPVWGFLADQAWLSHP